MITSILIFSSLLTQPSGDFSKTNETFAIAVEAQAPILGIGHPKYKRSRITRQNSPAKIFKRGKKLQRKNGIGMIHWQEVNHG